MNLFNSCFVVQYITTDIFMYSFALQQIYYLQIFLIIAGFSGSASWVDSLDRIIVEHLLQYRGDIQYDANGEMLVL